MGTNPYDETTHTVYGPKTDRFIESLLSSLSCGLVDIAFERAKQLGEMKDGNYKHNNLIIIDMNIEDEVIEEEAFFMIGR